MKNSFIKSFWTSWLDYGTKVVYFWKRGDKLDELGDKLLENDSYMGEVRNRIELVQMTGQVYVGLSVTWLFFLGLWTWPDIHFNLQKRAQKMRKSG